MYFISVFIVPSLKPLLKFVGKVGIRACLSGSYFFFFLSNRLICLGTHSGLFPQALEVSLTQGTLYFHPNSDLFISF